MRKNYCAIIAMTALLFSACGASQKAGAKSNNPYGEVMESNVCIEMQEQDPVRRQYGMGQHFKEATAGNIAESQARGAFARKIRSAIISATEEISSSMEVYSRDNQIGASVSDQNSTSNDWVDAVAMAVVNNVVPIKTQRYYNSEKQLWTIFKCMEYKGDVDQMVSNIIENVKEQIPQQEKAKIEANNDKYRQRILKSLSASK